MLSKEGGILKKLSSIFRFGLGVPVGTGNQIMSWIHEDDIIEIIDLVIVDSYNEMADINGDGRLDVLDIIILLQIILD